ncbi:DCC1-like thiol-disulfide oxidoreductase family protein [Streptomyces sp. NPDC006422]|uniref:thiol-disulfide oxidoreductase DCC family protein n=1 Tax=unclassified Streptomyces TaxID=2593676 RepID=UPI0033A0D563
MTAVGTAGRAAARGATGVAPVRRLTVLYDAECPLCTFARNWLSRQAQLVPLEFVPAGSEEALRRFPGLDHAATLSDITVLADGGQIYRGAAAWVVCMWALREHRATSHRMATPMGLRFAKQAVLGAAKYRESYRERRPGQRTDGWRYDPRRGWYHQAPTCDSGCRAAD